MTDGLEGLSEHTHSSREMGSLLLGGQESARVVVSCCGCGWNRKEGPHAWRHPRAACGVGTPTVEMHGNGLVLR